MDRKAARAAFDEYTKKYDLSNSMNRLKADHTLRVADNCETIAASLSLSEGRRDFAWLMGLLHDIGRFEQVKRYGTFVDSVSVDHAEFGADLLFKEDLINGYCAEMLSRQDLRVLETAIRLHNKLKLPEDLDDETRLFCNIIRDADKADIFRVVYELPFEERIGSSKAMILEGEEAGDEVMECVYSHRCIPRNIRKTRFEGYISHCSLAFELEFDETRRIVAEQGFLFKLLEGTDAQGKVLWSDKQLEQLRIVRQEIKKVW